MALMARTRAVPTVWRSATACGERQLRHSIRAIQTSAIATDAAIRGPGVDIPGGIPPVPAPQRRSALEKRMAVVNEAKPFSDFLTDTFNRQHDYLRISITERCNLRCLYCMPEEGIPLSPSAHMLTTPEIFYLSSLFVSQGVTKIRLTGGEPTVRRDIVPLMQQIGSLRSKGLRELALTTNGIALHRKLDAMVESGLTGVNLSLDTLDPFQFQIMTRRNGFDAVMKSINRILEMNKLGANVKLKVNCVVMRGLNEREILPFVEMGREKDIEVRFIEYMPFGGNKWSQGKMISFQEMLDIIRAKYPDLRSVPGHKNDTSKTYEVPGFVGKVGFITSMTNDFCGTCNRLRITSDGNLKVCLHGNAEVSLRDVLRQGNDGQPIDQEAFERIKQVEMDRHEGRLSDETVLGWGQRERELLDVVGAAVKRKAEKHADMGDLENMTNRPMILIDRRQPTGNFRRGCEQGQHKVARFKTLGLNSHVALNSPNPLHSPLHVPLPSNAISVRTYHSQSKSPIDDSRERDQVLGSSGEYMQAHVEGIAPRQHDQVLLQAVWERGIVESPLPENFEIVRRRYSMAGCEYNSYWRLAARSQLTGDAYIVHASAKARHKLRKIVQARVKKDLVVPRNTEGEVPSHGSLMNEAQRIADWPMKRNNEGNGGVERGPQDARDVSRDVEGLLADMEKHVPKSSMLESLGAEVQRLEDRVRTGQASRRSKRSRWRENKKLSKLQEEREAWKNIESDQRNIISELRSLRIARKKQSTAEKSQKFEQSKRLRELQTLRLDLLRKKRELLQQLEAEKNAQQIAEKARYEAEYRTRQSKEQSTDLGDVLDVALEKTIVDFDLKNSNSQKDKPPIVSVRSEPEITNRPFFRISLPTEEAQTQIQEARNEAMTGELINSKVTGDSLRFNVPESGKIPVDPEFTILLNGDTDHLQNQLNQMQTRLRASYPRIDTLPYDISQSKNRKTLQTWLKIMAGRWQTRSNHTEDASTVNTEVKAVLDQMVRDHDLSNSAANRMAKRWSEIFDKRDAVASSIEPTIDWNEFSAGGMDFLKANDVDGIQDNQRLEAESVPLEAEIITVSNEADARREKSTKDNDQCESDANSMTVMETGHVGGAGKDDAQQSEHTTPKATHLTTHKRQTASPLYDSNTRRLYSTLSRPPIDPIRIPQDGQSNPLPAESQAASPAPSLPHLTPSGSAHMVSVSTKAHTIRSAIAVGTVYFSNPTALGLIKSNSLKKGDVLSVSRIAGIMAAKKCPDLIPLCHPIPLTHVGVELQVFGNEAEKNHGGNDMGFGGVMIEAKVSCTGPTGVEMEALTSVMGTALSVVDMCKAVDKFQRIQDVRVVLKEGGKSGTWAEEGWKSFQR